MPFFFSESQGTLTASVLKQVEDCGHACWPSLPTDERLWMAAGCWPLAGTVGWRGCYILARHSARLWAQVSFTAAHSQSVPLTKQKHWGHGKTQGAIWRPDVKGTVHSKFKAPCLSLHLVDSVQISWPQGNRNSVLKKKKRTSAIFIIINHLTI